MGKLKGAKTKKVKNAPAPLSDDEKALLADLRDVAGGTGTKYLVAENDEAVVREREEDND